MNRPTQFLRNALSRWRTERAIAAAPAAAADLGIAPADLLAIARHPGDLPDRMGRMAARFGASGAMARLGRWESLDMTRACAACPHRRACDRALDTQAAAETCGFCPNAATYRRLAAADA